ncbi:hypothetical protein CEP52_016481, partial [Fusarium oligoseptatum]
MPRTTRTSAEALGLEPEGVQRRHQDVVVRKTTPREAKEAADLTDGRIQEYQQKLRQLQRLLSGLEANSPDFDFKHNELAPLIKKDGKPIIDAEPIITKWLEVPRSFSTTWTYMKTRAIELNQLAQDKQGKARIDALGQLELGKSKAAKRIPTETMPVDTAADETTTSNEAVLGQHSENAPPQPASQTWWDDSEFVASELDLDDDFSLGGEGHALFSQSNLQHDLHSPPIPCFERCESEVEPRRVGGWKPVTEAVPPTNMFTWNSARDIEATIPDPKPTSHLKEGIAISRENHRDDLGELSAVLNRQLRDGFEPREHETPPCLGSSAFANGDMGQSPRPLRVSPESNGYLSHTSPPTSIQSPVLEDSPNPTPVGGPASGASGTTDRREKRRLVGEWYQWWLQRHREKYGAGSRQSGYKPLSEDSCEKNRG